MGTEERGSQEWRTIVFWSLHASEIRLYIDVGNLRGMHLLPATASKSGSDQGNMLPFVRVCSQNENLQPNGYVVTCDVSGAENLQPEHHVASQT